MARESDTLFSGPQLAGKNAVKAFEKPTNFYRVGVIRVHVGFSFACRCCGLCPAVSRAVRALPDP